MKQAMSLLGSMDSATPNGSASSGAGLRGPTRHKSSAGKHQNKVEKTKLHITSSLTFQDLQGEVEGEGQGEESGRAGTMPKQKVASHDVM